MQTSQAQSSSDGPNTCTFLLGNLPILSADPKGKGHVGRCIREARHPGVERLLCRKVMRALSCFIHEAQARGGVREQSKQGRRTNVAGKQCCMVRSWRSPDKERPIVSAADSLSPPAPVATPTWATATIRVHNLRTYERVCACRYACCW